MVDQAVRDTILVVDDEPETRRSIIRFLATRFVEYDTLEASDGHEALSQLSDRVALAICDVNMPNTDGFELCRKLRADPTYERYAELPVVLLTSRDTEDDYLRGLDVGTTLYVTKPFDAELLHRAVATVLGE